MNSSTVFSLWAAIGAPLANHLWQSTLFAGVAGLLTLALRKNQARTRYWLWLSASAKFLLPFSLLTSMGSHLSWSRPPGMQAELSVVQEIARPFAATGTSKAAVSAGTALVGVLRILPDFLLFIWLCGVIGVLFFWWLRWRRLTVALLGTSPVESGRELEALRRVERSQGTTEPIELVISNSSLEPGIAGIFHPVMLLPEGISNRLSDAQLEAILAHELCHVRRRDNLAAAMHMLVEAAFWFHPLMWWIGARLVDERERACDEEVLGRGSNPQVYAESILKVCEFYLESPLFCAAGVTGSNLKRRIEAIMKHHIASKLVFGKKLLLATFGILAIAGPVVIGFVNPAPSLAQDKLASSTAAGFQSVSVNPSQATQPMFFINTKDGTANFTGYTLRDLIKYAYAVDDSQIVGGPDWITAKRYDINAKGSGENSFNFAMVQLAAQKLLADQFKLVIHRETRELSVYELTVGRNGSKLEEVRLGNAATRKSRLLTKPPGHLEAQQVGMADLARQLSAATGLLVVDKTNLKGIYNFTLNWLMPSPDVAAVLSTALPEQLGLELNAQTGPVGVLVVDRAEEIATDIPVLH